MRKSSWTILSIFKLLFACVLSATSLNVFAEYYFVCSRSSSEYTYDRCNQCNQCVPYCYSTETIVIHSRAPYRHNNSSAGVNSYEWIGDP